MKKVKDLTVKVTYKVGLGNVEIPENVYDQLLEAYYSNEEIDTSEIEKMEAAEWLSNNIKESDCMDWKAEIEELEVSPR